MTNPARYLLPMLLFLAVVGLLAWLLRAPLERVFLTNPALNAAILAVLLIGIAQSFGRLWQLVPEIKWVELRKRPEAGLAPEDPPTLLAPMAAMLGDRRGLSLSTASTRSLLDSVGARLEESRDTSRYLIGLLIFLGLLGTFWGLLDTISTVSETIKSLSLTSGDVTKLFSDLQEGLRGPLSGMGTAFGSSLFGLSGSLVLGFLDLQSSQAQNRFYNELEEWLAGITRLSVGDGDVVGGPVLPAMLEQTTERLDGVLRALTALEGGRARLDQSLTQLAERLGQLSERLGQQDQLTRRLAEGQLALEPLLRRLAAPPPPGVPPELPAAALEQLRAIAALLQRLADRAEAPAMAVSDAAAQRRLGEIETTIQRLASALEVMPAPGAGDAGVAEHLKMLEQAMLRLVELSERPPAIAMMPAGDVAAGAAWSGDGAAAAHLARIEEHLRQLAREAGQIQHRIAQEVRGELRGFAESIAALAEEPPAPPEP